MIQPSAESRAAIEQAVNSSPIAPVTAYPQATSAIDTVMVPPSISRMSSQQADSLISRGSGSKKIKIVSIIIGLLISLSAVVTILRASSAHVNVVVTVLYGLESLLGVGIAMQNALARSIFVVLSLIGLALSTYGVLFFLSNPHKTGGQVLAFMLSYAIGLGPLIFLTRPSVKAEFS